MDANPPRANWGRSANPHQTTHILASFDRGSKFFAVDLEEVTATPTHQAVERGRSGFGEKKTSHREDELDLVALVCWKYTHWKHWYAMPSTGSSDAV